MTTLQLVMLIASLVTTLIGSVGGFAWFLASRIKDVETRLGTEIKEVETRMVAAIGDLRGEIGYLRGRIDSKERPDI